MLDHPIIKAVRKMKGETEVNVIIDTSTSDGPIQPTKSNEAAIKDMNDMNKTVMDFVKPKHSLTDVHNFQFRFNNRGNVSRAAFLTGNDNSPTYDDQIMSGIIACMNSPLDKKMPACGYHIKQGEKMAREREKQTRAQRKLKAIELGEEEPESDKDEKKEKETPEQAKVMNAIRICLGVFKYIHDHRSTLEPREKGVFQTPILKAIKNADIEGVKYKGRRKVVRMKAQDLKKMINKCVAAKSTFPSWYTTKVGNGDKNDKSIPSYITSILDSIFIPSGFWRGESKGEGSRNTDL